MLAKRIIPCLDVKDGRVVKGVNFINFVDAGDPAENGKFYDEEGADELTFLDITASSDKRNIIIDMVKQVAGRVHIPFTVGGGIRTLEDIRLILENGADKVSINTAAVKTPWLIEEAAKLFGSQCIVVAIDAKKNAISGDWNVYLNGGRTKTDIDAIAWAFRMQERGAGEILLTSMDRDGTKEGYDLELTRGVAERVQIPVIASGGAGSVEDIYMGLTEGKADGALVASILHFREISVKQIKEQLSLKGLSIRPVYQ